MGGTEAVIAAIAGGASVLQQAQAASAQNRALATQQAQQQRQIEATRQIEKRRRKEQLSRDRAAQRARFGALGLSADGGSAAAVLRGLSTRASQDIADRNRLTSLRLQGLQGDFSGRRRRNLLEVRNSAFDQSIGLFRRFGSGLFKK